ncbi:hypothetical protein [Neobacillus vireti]|uniref:hypothetical protein n=1 Tax=Neobacillus vireti TaxID=220686 RepID=UPI003000F66C
MKKKIDAYLDIEGIIEIAKAHDVDAIIPDMDFYQKVSIFKNVVKMKGLSLLALNQSIWICLMIKVKARHKAVAANIPVIPGTDGPIGSLEEVKALEETMAIISIK